MIRKFETPVSLNLPLMKKAFIVLNPVSGLGNADRIRKKIIQNFTSADFDFYIYETTGKDSLKEIVNKELEKKPDLVVVCGGDGTISQVASGMINSNIPLGVIPSGTWNAMARNLHIPIFPDEAIQLITGSHSLRVIDAMEVNGDNFLGNVGAGFSSSMVSNTNREAKRRFGFLAYFYNLFIQAFGLSHTDFHLVIDGQEIKEHGAEIMAVNSIVVGIGELPTRLNIQPGDGRIELLIYKPRSIFSIFPVAWNLLVRGKNKLPHFSYYPAYHSIQIQTKKPVPFQGDGDIIGKTPITINVIPQAIKLIVPHGTINKIIQPVKNLHALLKELNNY